MRAAFERLADMDDVFRRVGELSARTVIFDVEPLVAYWDSGQDALDRGVALVLSQVGAVAGVRLVCFATNSLRRPSVVPAGGNVRVVYLAAARKPLRLARGLMVSDEPGRIFREAWIAGVKKHYPGEPKPGYVTSWEETPDWERQAAAAVYGQVHQFIDVSSGTTSKLSREQKGRFVALCWIAQICKHIPDPKPAYVADWDELPQWQQETDADIFERVELEG